MKKIIDLGLLFIIMLLLYRQYPVVWNSFQQENKIMKRYNAFDLEGSEVKIPTIGFRGIYIFWATWCGPCHKQMDMFSEAISEGAINKDQVVALSLGEKINVVNEFVKSKKLKMKVLVDPSGKAWEFFNVMATPSIAFINESSKIEYFTAGFSPMAVSKAKKFLKK